MISSNGVTVTYLSLPSPCAFPVASPEMARGAVSGPPFPRLPHRVPPTRAMIHAAFTPPAPVEDDATITLVGLLAPFALPRARDVTDRPESVRLALASTRAAAAITTRASSPRTALVASRPGRARAIARLRSIRSVHSTGRARVGVALCVRPARGFSSSSRSYPQALNPGPEP